MKYWNYFWLANFAVAGLSFIIITLVVVVRGAGEMRKMLKNLRCGAESRRIEERLAILDRHEDYKV